MVDMSLGHDLLSFMDAFLRYNKILMILEDEDKIAFIIDQGFFYHRIMPCRLKNMGVTYQCLMNKVFKDLIELNMKVYNNMLIKSKIVRIHIEDLQDTFSTL